MTNEDIQQIKKCIDEVLNKKPKEQRINYFTSTEKILYSFNKLKIKIEIDKEDILDLIKEQQNKESTHKRCSPNEWDAEIDDTIRHKQKIRNRERSMIRTEKLIRRFERCLQQIKDDEYYDIIPCVYFDNKTLSEVAEGMYCSPRTISRHKTRLINDLIVLLYGADALE